MPENPDSMDTHLPVILSLKTTGGVKPSLSTPVSELHYSDLANLKASFNRCIVKGTSSEQNCATTAFLGLYKVGSS